MKKLMTVMLGLSLTLGSAAVVFGQAPPPTKEDGKDKGDKKGKDDKGDKKGKDDKGDKKGKDDKGKN